MQRKSTLLLKKNKVLFTKAIFCLFAGFVIEGGVTMLLCLFAGFVIEGVYFVCLQGL